MEAQGRSESCRSARVGLAWYRSRYNDHRELRGAKTEWPVGIKPIGCGHAQQLARVWKGKALTARKFTAHWLNEHLLRDFRYCDGCEAWGRAISEAQKVFPGTSAWLWTCSHAEGGWGRWVGYDGVSYSTWLRDSNTVGGNMQFRFGTFVSMWRAALSYAIERNFVVPRGLRDWNSLVGLTRAWRSALGQALAGAWARYTGNDASHWSASWSNGC